MTNDFTILSFQGQPDLNRDFIAVKQSVYNKEQYMWKKKEDISPDFLLQYWIVFQNKIPVARACLYFNPALKWEQLNVPCIGNFESIRNLKITKALLSIIEVYAYAQGFSSIIGPMNGSTFNQYRFPTTNIVTPFFSEDYYPEYYASFWVHCGYVVIGNYISCLANLDFLAKAPNNCKQQVAKKYPLIYRPINLLNFENELEEIYALLSRSFEQNKFYTPITLDSFLAQYLPYKKYINTDFFWLAELSGTIVAAIYCLPDYYSIDRLVIKTILVDPSVRRLGIMQEMGHIIYNKAMESHYVSIIHAYMHLHNGSVSLSEKFGGNTIRSYALYGKHLGL